MPAAVPYIELHAHSAFSFLDGASTPAELAGAAARYGYPAFALTDHDGVWGSMEFALACRELGLRPITGAELTLSDGAHLTLLVETQAGYRNLCRLLTAAHSHTRDGAQRAAGQPSVPLAQVEARSEGLVCLSGCARDGLLAGAWERGEAAAGAALARRLLEAFGRDRFRVELQRPYWRRDRTRNRWLANLAGRLGVPTRRHRQRPLPRPPPRPPPGRLRRGAAGDDAGGLRARPPRQLELGAQHPAADGRALRRAPRGGRRDPAPRRAAPLRPHRAARLHAIPAPRTSTPTASWPRSAGRGSRSATASRATASTATRPRGSSSRSWRRSATSASPASSSSTGRSSSWRARWRWRCGARSRRAPCCPPAAAAAPASARSSAT